MINIKSTIKNYDLILCKTNFDEIGQIHSDFLNNIKRSISEIDSLEIYIPKNIQSSYKKKNKRYLLFDEIKEKRVININDKEYFTIENIKSVKDSKVLTAYSLEYKLSRIDVNLESCSLQLFTSSIDDNIVSLNEKLKDETGWSLGEVDSSVSHITIDNITSEKVRWQESVATNWYDYLTKDIREQFECVVVFDSYNKTVNLYNVDSFGDQIGICLTYDNYIKDLEIVNDTKDIVTKLEVTGSEELSINEVNPMGTNYLENYSYFIDNKEMSDELISAILTYNGIVKERTATWKQLITLVLEKKVTLDTKQMELYELWEKIKYLISIRKRYEIDNDVANAGKIAAEITEKNDQATLLDLEIKSLDAEVNQLQSSIDEINILCQKKTATDSNGSLIFNAKLLDELKNFIYCGTFVNDSVTDPEDLLRMAERELEIKCRPTTVWNIDVVNFLNRVLLRPGRIQWNGELSIGDIISLQIDNKEELIYLVGYTENRKGNTLTLELSDKKLSTDNSRVIGDVLKKANNSLRKLTMKSYLWNNQKYHRTGWDK